MTAKERADELVELLLDREWLSHTVNVAAIKQMVEAAILASNREVDAALRALPK